MCNDFFWEEWEIKVIEQLLHIEGAELVVVISPAHTSNAHQTTTRKILRYPYRRFLWNKFRRFWFWGELFRRSDFRIRFGDVPCISVKVDVMGKNRERVDTHGIAEISRYNPDLLFRFGFNILTGEILQLPRLGVWSFHHADPHEIRGGPMGFWEIFHGFRSTAVVLQRLNEKLDRGEILAYRRFTTSLHSYREHVGRLIMNSIDMPAQVLRSMVLGVWCSPVFKPLSHQISRLYHIPGNHLVMIFFLKLLYRRFQFYYRRLFVQEHWKLYFFDNLKNENIEIYNNIQDGYLADPFLFTDESGNCWIYAEQFSRWKEKGRIVRIKLGLNNSLEVVLETPYHLAYPFLIRNENSIGLIPDASVSGKVVFYFISQPFSLVSSPQVLVDFPGVDPTVVFFNGFWWLWCTRAGIEADSELHLFYATELKGPFSAHAGNPVKFDCSSSRSAGRPVVFRGELYRPSQNCSKTYGGDLVWQKVEVLDPHSYFESAVDPPFAMPLKGKAAGLHHYDSHENDFVYDLKSYRFSFASFVRHLESVFRSS